MQSSKEQQGEKRKPYPENERYKGTFHKKMGTIKDRNCIGLAEAEDIKKRW